MAIDEVYKVIDQQSLLGQEVLNVYYYQSTTDGTLQAENLFNAFVSDMLPAIVATQSDLLFHNIITVESVTNPADFFEGSLTADNEGTNAGSVNDPFGAWGFKLTRSTRETRNGSKRIGGTTDGSVVNGEAVGGIVALLNTLAGQMGSDITDGVVTFIPVIRHLTRAMIVAEEPPTFFPISGAGYERYTSQVSRKFGRGA